MLHASYIERTRRLPYAGQITVSVGDWVLPEQEVGRIDYLPGAMRRVDAASALGIKGNRLQEHLLLTEGDAVQCDDSLAVSSCFGERRSSNSPYCGYLGLVSRVLGHVYVREPIPVGEDAPLVMDVSTGLGVSGMRLLDCLRVREGMVVSPGQVIARKGTGVGQQLLQSSMYGRVTEIADGKVTITPLHMRTSLNAYLEGRVVQVEAGQSVTIRAYAHRIPGQYGVGGEAGGNLLVVGSPDSELDEALICDAWKGRVVCGGESANLSALRKAASAGARALVLGHLSLETLMQYVGESKAVGLTGDEDIEMPVILLDGFLRTPFSHGTWARLLALDGRHAAVNGTTHIRAGVIRPEIVVCESAWAGPELQGPAAQPGICNGSLVRVLRAPHAGDVGTVVELPPERRRIATGAAVRVAVVELRGEVHCLPLCNLEPWDESMGGGINA